MSHAVKRRQLIWLSAASTALIVIMWIFYMQKTFTAAPADPAKAAEPGALAVFKTGLAKIGETVETGLVNSYLYFHTVASEGKTFTITK